ncbi:DUF333 domain-containing protein [Phaeovibrio sulfidiphilus]|uniref:DUF333 domain-containing protein n=1 Tax=Phaeovibrio sulfidiphilus TaxID=1220600 RepID=A0A8J7CBK2_9PROT|nr:DUF333 domain-containing protein [Phaeovibrio sulfidiphilus]MBE1236258.1 DUF333 domain-containing protein [Phaeovibrio sulfidiphilus]
MKKAVMIIGAALLLTACDSGETKSNEDAEKAVGMPNPAYTYCIEEKGGKVENRPAESGDLAICILPDGTEIEVWELFRQEHPQPDADGGETGDQDGDGDSK